MYIDIHSHQPLVSNEFVFQNKYNHFQQTVTGGNYSIGLHPWYLNETTWFEEMKALEQYCKNKNILAIGECGLDKIFFETDAAVLKIEEVYSLAAADLQIDINSLSLQIPKNAVTIFGDTLFTI